MTSNDAPAAATDLQKIQERRADDLVKLAARKATALERIASALERLAAR
jgi:hypothetical protein